VLSFIKKVVLKVRPPIEITHQAIDVQEKKQQSI